MDPHHAQIKREERERKPRREDEGDVFLEEFDRSLLDGLL